jgi:UDP-glucose 4-epimerase
MGYIGSKLYAKLKELGHDVHGVDIASLDPLEGLDIRKHLFHNGRPWLKFVPDYVFHLAAKPSVQWSVENPSESLSHNVLGSSRVLEFAAEAGARRVIFASSAAAYGVASPYGLHKLMTEKECKVYTHLYNIDTVSLRYFNVYSADQKCGGPYSTVIAAWMDALRCGYPLRIDGDGTQTRDFIHVDDIIAANIFCMNYAENFDGATYDVGTGTETSIDYIRQYINQRLSASWQEVPEREGDIKFSCANAHPMKDLGWSAQVGIKDGLDSCFFGG